MHAKVLAAFLLWGAWGCRAGPRPGNSGSDLQPLYDAHQWFALREALVGQTAPALYRGAVAAAFNRQADAENVLKPLLAAESDSEANDAAKWLDFLYIRLGLYQKAAALMDGDSALDVMIRALPDQCTGAFSPGSLACRMFQRRLFIPLSMNRQTAEFFIDSDANFSFLSESEARNLGLAIQESDVKIHGVTGDETGFRMAVVDHLQIGNAELRNVAFLILADNEAVFRNLAARQQGAVGLPVLLALQSLRINRQGTLEIGSAPSNANAGEPNLCFDGLDPVTRAKFGSDYLSFVLDTGAEASDIWPPFAKRFPELVSSAKAGLKLEQGVGGQARVPEAILPEFAIEAGGFETHLHSAHVLLAPTTPDSSWYYGRLGLDVLCKAQQITIDFESLQLQLQ